MRSSSTAIVFEMRLGLSEGVAVRQRTHFVPHPVFFPSRPDTPRSETGKTLKLLLLGRMEEYKGLPILVEACKRLIASGADIQLRIAGRGPALDALAPSIANYEWLSPHTAFLSAMELDDELLNCDVLVLPYIEGSASGLIARGLGFSKCIVASDVGTFREYIDDGRTGLLVKPRSVEALRDTLGELARDPGRVETIKRNAYNDARSRFAPDLIAARTLEVYSAACNVRAKMQ